MKMKLIFTCLVISLASNLYSQSFTENFSYPAGSDIGWGSSGPLGVERIKAVSPGLIFPNYSGSGIDNAAKLDNQANYIHMFRIFDPSPGTSSGSVYVSLLVRVTNEGSGEVMIAGFSSTLSLYTTYDFIHVRDSANKIAFGMSKRNASPTFTYARYSRNITYLLILKQVFVPSSSDSLSLFVFSSAAPSNEPRPTIGPVTSGDDIPGMSAMFLYQDAPGISSIVDGISINSYWNNNVLPVELASLNSIVEKNNVSLSWVTSFEENNFGFDIERKDSDIENWTRIAFMSGYGNSSSPGSYEYTDRNLNSGKYLYRLRQIDFNGNFEYHNFETEVVIGIPTKFSLSQNYPNPFNPSTKINYEIPVDGDITLKLFDINGKEVMEIAGGFRTSGYYTSVLDLSSLPSGIYFYRLSLESGGQIFSSSKKMSLIK